LGQLRWASEQSQSAGSVRHTSTKFFGWKKTSVKIFFCLHYSEREARSLSSTEFINAARMVQVVEICGGAQFSASAGLPALIALIYTHRLIFDAISKQGVHAEAHISA
jgi:hypothetical protein